MEFHFEVLEMQKRNEATNRPQIVNEKMRSLVCLSGLLLGTWSFKMFFKIPHFLYFLLMKAKRQSQFG